jgi:hypothetical protein
VKKLIVIGAGVFAAAVASLTLISQADAAPDQTGQTFAEAKAALTGAGYSAVVPRPSVTSCRRTTALWSVKRPPRRPLSPAAT